MKQAILLVLLFFFSVNIPAKENIYIDNGIASSKEVWIDSDYKALLQALKDNKVPYPIIDSGESGEIFSAMVSEKNLQFFDFYLSDKAGLGPANSIKNALTLGVSMLENTRFIFQLYLEDSVKYERELAEQLAFMTTLSGNLLIVANKFVEFNEGNLTDVQKNGFKKMRSGLMMIMDGLIASISEPQFSDASLTSMSESLDKNINNYSQLYDEENRKVIIARLDIVKNRQENSFVKSNLTSAIEKLKSK